MRYRIGTDARGRQTIYTLHDEQTGAFAAVLPSYGFNLFDLRLPLAGEARPVIVAAADFAESPRGAAGNGIPILFPFPNRIRGGTYSFHGRTFTIPPNNGPNAIHGFAAEATWEVVEHKADSSSAFIVGRYQISRCSPTMLPNWPADAVLQVRYSLADRRLTMTVNVTNPTAEDLPYGFGIHPYFRLPLPAGRPGRAHPGGSCRPPGSGFLKISCPRARFAPSTVALISARANRWSGSSSMMF